MLNITITEQTPHNMLRAIRAACNELLGETHADLTTQAAQHNSRAEELRVASERELDKSASCLSRYGQGGPLNVDKVYPVGEQEAQQMVQRFREAHPEVAAAGQAILGAAFDKTVEATGAQAIAQSLVDAAEPAPTADEILTSFDVDSTGAEWNPELHASTKAKNQDGTWKKRRGAGKADEPQVENIGHAGQVAPPALPPLPPAAPAAPLVTMNDIYALITNGKAVLNDVIATAQAMGFADVGAFSRDATPEQRAQLLAQLTKEVA